MAAEQDYKYQTDKDLSRDLFNSFDDYFKPIFESCKISKKTFILQIINFILVFLLLNFLLGGVLDYLITGVKGSAIFSIKVFLLILIVGFISAIKKNRILCWQTLFNMSRILTKKYLKRLIFTNILLYGIKEIHLYYEERNKR